MGNILFDGIDREDSFDVEITIDVAGVAKFLKYKGKESGVLAPYCEIELDYDEDFIKKQIFKELQDKLEDYFDNFKLKTGCDRLIGFPKRMDNS